MTLKLDIVLLFPRHMPYESMRKIVKISLLYISLSCPVKGNDTRLVLDHLFSKEMTMNNLLENSIKIKHRIMQMKCHVSITNFTRVFFFTQYQSTIVKSCL